MEGLNDMVSQTLELKHKQIAREAAHKTELKMLVKMKIAGIPKSAIIEIAQSENIPEEEINRIFDDKEE